MTEATLIKEETEYKRYNMKQCWDWLDKNAKRLPHLNELMDSHQLTDLVNNYLKYKVNHQEFMAATIEAGYNPKRVLGTEDSWYLDIEIKA